MIPYENLEVTEETLGTDVAYMGTEVAIKKIKLDEDMKLKTYGTLNCSSLHLSTHYILSITSSHITYHKNCINKTKNNHEYNTLLYHTMDKAATSMIRHDK